MQKFAKTAIAGAVAMAVAQSASAATPPFFIPLADPEVVDVADGFKVIDESDPSLSTYTQIRSVDEINGPWKVAPGVTFENLMSLEEVENTVDQSVIRVAAGNNSAMFDMLAYDPTGRYVFIPAETPFGAGVTRYDTVNDESQVLFKGDESEEGFTNDTDFGAFDPARWTPNGTVLLGEEWSGAGRLVEVCDPLGAPPVDPTPSGMVQGDCGADAGAQYRILDNLPTSAWEGISFSEKYPNEVMYFVDEDRSGSVYKTMFAEPGNYNSGATYVLVVDGFAGDPAERFDREPNIGQPRTGQAQWVPITDMNGEPLEGIRDPRLASDRAANLDDPGQTGRWAADDVNGTPFGRPEDTTLSTLANGNEVLYFAATSEATIYSVEETPDGPIVRATATPDTPKNLGFAETSAVLNSPDNLAIDALGNIYIIEDSPNTTTIGASGGDIWFIRDVDNDGIAESIDLFMSLQVAGSEATGMIFDPVDPTKFVVAVQHPRSTGLSDEDNLVGESDEDSDGVRSSEGMGDAVWQFDLSNVQPPACNGPRSNGASFNAATGQWVRTCTSLRDVNFIEQMQSSEPAGDFPQP